MQTWERHRNDIIIIINPMVFMSTKIRLKLLLSLILFGI